MTNHLKFWCAVSLAILQVNSALLWAFPTATAFTVISKAELALPISDQPPACNTVAKIGTRERWNDWGIGLLLQGDLKGSEFAFKKATEAEPGYADAWLNVARPLVQDGETDAAKPYLEKALALNPSLRRVLLKRQYAKAVEYCQRICDVDTEDVQMHYTAMLCYKGLGDTEKANREQVLFERFKADESAQAVTAKRRLASPEDNNERQLVHAHESVPLP